MSQAVCVWLCMHRTSAAASSMPKHCQVYVRRSQCCTLDCCFPQLQSQRDRNLVRIVQLSVLAAVLLRHHHTLVTEYIDTACSPAAAAPSALATLQAPHTPVNSVWRWIAAVQLPRIPSIGELVPSGLPLEYSAYSAVRSRVLTRPPALRVVCSDSASMLWAYCFRYQACTLSAWARIAGTPVREQRRNRTSLQTVDCACPPHTVAHTVARAHTHAGTRSFHDNVRRRRADAQVILRDTILRAQVCITSTTAASGREWPTAS
jgi:hypothetical protein